MERLRQPVATHGNGTSHVCAVLGVLPFASGCHPLRPLGSIKAHPSLSSVATKPSRAQRRRHLGLPRPARSARTGCRRDGRDVAHGWAYRAVDGAARCAFWQAIAGSSSEATWLRRCCWRSGTSDSFCCVSGTTATSTRPPPRRQRWRRRAGAVGGDARLRPSNYAHARTGVKRPETLCVAPASGDDIADVPHL